MSLFFYCQLFPRCGFRSWVWERGRTWLAPWTVQSTGVFTVAKFRSSQALPASNMKESRVCYWLTGKRIHPFLLLPLCCSKGRNHWECPLDRSAVHHRTNINPQMHSSGYLESPIIPMFMFLISGRKLANTLGEASIEDDHTVRYSHCLFPLLLPVHITFG